MDTTPLPPDFRDLLKCLNDHGVEYLLIGGWAVVSHGYTRLTNDIDVWIAISPDTAKRVRKSLLAFIGESPTVEELQTPDRVIRMGIPPHRVEILTAISGVSFADCYSRRVIRKFDDIDVPVISVADLLVNKLASGRTKDMNDVEYLRKYYGVATEAGIIPKEKSKPRKRKNP